MKILSTYSVKIKHFNNIFKKTVSIYRDAVNYLIPVCFNEWNSITAVEGNKARQMFVETLVHKTGTNENPKYDFDSLFYKFPCYMRRSAITEAIGKVSSYKSSLANWETEDPATRGKPPKLTDAGFVYPCLYRGNMYEQTGEYTAKIKVFIRNTWDWLEVKLDKGDIDYINRRCKNRKMCAPTLQKRGREWFLDFPFEETVELCETTVFDRTVVAVDLGINAAATVSVMRSDGTILGRHFLRLPSEYDSLNTALNRIKKAQQHGAKKTPRLWVRAKGINDNIAVKTASFIMDIAVLYNADVIVFEHLDRSGRKRGSKKQRLHIWRSQYVQAMVTDKAHRCCMRISHICAWNTSRLAYDGSGRVKRGKEADLGSYSICRFANGKVYNCDLNASYNIGARYFIRELLKPLPERERLELEANVPEVSRRSTCTLSSLISLNAGFQALTA